MQFRGRVYNDYKKMVLFLAVTAIPSLPLQPINFPSLSSFIPPLLASLRVSVFIRFSLTKVSIPRSDFSLTLKIFPRHFAPFNINIPYFWLAAAGGIDPVWRELMLNDSETSRKGGGDGVIHHSFPHFIRQSVLHSHIHYSFIPHSDFSLRSKSSLVISF